MDLNLLIEQSEGFDWDEGNREKNWIKHLVKAREAEEVFLNSPAFFGEDLKHSQGEPRYYSLGQTNSGRTLFISFTVRGKKIRVISVRDQNKQERREYEKTA